MREGAPVLIICGLRSYLEVLGIVTLVCRACGNPVAHRIEEQVRRVTLFFVPLFQISRRTRMTCTYCGTTTELGVEDAGRLLVHAHTNADADPARRESQDLAQNGDHHPDTPLG
jgi:transcription elongation factor Elf1